MNSGKKSEAVCQLIKKVREVFPYDKRMTGLFENCIMNTLDTTVKRLEDGTTYVLTGDIPAMWLRDSTAQVQPYLMAAASDEELSDLIAGLVRRQFFYINVDPYANAFNQEPDGSCWEHDETDMGPFIWERKYELDSLCYPIQLAYLLWKNTGRTDQFDEVFVKGINLILDVWKTEQQHEEKSKYSFVRKCCRFTDTLSRGGKGALVKSGTGLIWSGFRPSDDACVYGYLIPSNMFAVVVLGYLKEIAKEVLQDRLLEQRAAAMKDEVWNAIEKEAVIEHEQFGRIYAYEVDGYGQYLLMDDANVPSLLSAGYLGYTGKDPQTMENTRNFILSNANPCFYAGKKASGIGSIHTPADYIWHIALAVQGLTSQSSEEKRQILELMRDTDGGTGMMHEGFHADDPGIYTREWFSWANAMFCELVLDYCKIRVKR